MIIAITVVPLAKTDTQTAGAPAKPITNTLLRWLTRERFTASKLLELPLDLVTIVSIGGAAVFELAKVLLRAYSQCLYYRPGEMQPPPGACLFCPVDTGWVSCSSARSVGPYLGNFGHGFDRPLESKNIFPTTEIPS